MHLQYVFGGVCYLYLVQSWTPRGPQRSTKLSLKPFRTARAILTTTVTTGHVLNDTMTECHHIFSASGSHVTSCLCVCLLTVSHSVSRWFPSSTHRCCEDHRWLRAGRAEHMVWWQLHTQTHTLELFSFVYILISMHLEKKALQFCFYIYIFY